MGSQLFIAFTFLFLFPSESAAPAPATAPLAFKCSSPENHIGDPSATQTLLHKLTETASKSGFATALVTVESDRLIGLMQCRSVLSPAACTACLKTATNTVSSICNNADALSAWFEGCYFHHYYSSRAEEFARETRPVATWSNDSYACDRDQFATAVHALVLRLGAVVGETSHHGFSYADTAYGGDRHAYVAVECLRSLSPVACEACLAGATKTARECCAGKSGGLVVAGDCMVRFESFRFVVSSGADSWDPSGDTIYDEEEEADGFRDVKVKMVLWSWAVGVSCVVGFAMGAWLLRRRILLVKIANIPIDSS